MKQFFKKFFENMDIIDKVVLVVLCLPLILPIIITIFSGQYLPGIGFLLRNNPWMIGYMIGRISGILLVFIVYRAIRIHIKKEKLRKKIKELGK